MLLTAGSFLVCGGGSIAAVAAFDGRFVETYAGFLCFNLGYIVLQRAHGTSELNGLSRRLVEWDLGLLLIGTAVAAFGAVVTATATSDPTVRDAVIGGVCLVVGYVLAHYGINNTYV